MLEEKDKIQIDCTNPEEIRLAITIELNMSQWEKVIQVFNHSNTYYDPFMNLMIELQNAIRIFKEKSIFKI